MPLQYRPYVSHVGAGAAGLLLGQLLSSGKLRDEQEKRQALQGQVQSLMKEVDDRCRNRVEAFQGLQGFTCSRPRA